MGITLIVLKFLIHFNCMLRTFALLQCSFTEKKQIEQIIYSLHMNKQYENKKREIPGKL